jgi:glyceraldehyde-3-phosphate dehydrogenase/erythrose-4-phosphate dehydrogenase
MGATRVVHVVGTGTLGGPVMSLLLHLQHELEVDEITFHKNRPLLNDRTKILSLMRRGAKLAVEAEKMADFEKLGMLPTYTRQSALEQATVVIDCTAEGLRLQHKRVWYEHMPAARGFIAQGREFGFGKMYAHGINDAVLVPNEDRFLQVVSCNTHNLAVLIETLALQANKYMALTEKTMASTVFPFGRDHGYFGRLLNQTVVSMPMHDALPV